MRTHVVAFFLSLGVSALLTPIVSRLAIRLGVVDIPDGQRKTHQGSVPRMGGIAMALGFIAPILGLLIYTNVHALEIQSNPERLRAFLVGWLMIILLGIYDDIRGANAYIKLSVQSCVGVVLWWGGMSFDELWLWGHHFEFGWLSLPITIVWTASLINALNLIDGLDGLASGVAFFAGLSLFSWFGYDRG